jgi:hypothetical protein
LKAPALPYKSDAEKKADTAAAASAKNAEAPAAGDAKDDGKLAKAEHAAEAAEGQSKKEAFEAAAAEEGKKNPGNIPENVSIIEPMAYERMQNYNKLKEYAPRPTPEPYIMRTTFY